MSWSNVALSTLVDIKGGGTPSKANPEYWNGSIPWASVKDFKSSDLNGASDYITQEGIDNSATSLIPRGNLIVPTRMALGKIAINSVDIAINQDLKALIIKDESVVDTEYLFRCIQSKSEEIVRQGKGATVKGITVDVLKNLQIPLPPLETQKQIAKVLEKADQLRKDCKLLEQELNSLAQSVFIDMFGDPVTNPKGWEVRALSNVVETIQGGKSPKCESRPALNNEWGILKLSAVTGGLYRPDQNKAILEGTLPNPDIELKQGDLLFTRKNTYELVGACAYVRETPEQLMLPDLIFRFQMPEQLKVYLWGLLNNQSFNLKVRALASGAAGSMPNIAKSKLYDLTLPLPPESEIEKYTRSIVGIWEQQDTLKELRGSYQANFNALMQKAFKGELTL